MKGQKMKRFKALLCYGLMLIMLITLPGCGGSAKFADTAAMATDSNMAYEAASADLSYYSYDEDVAIEKADNEEGAESDTTENTQTLEDTGRKLIKTVDMNVETKDFDGLIPLIEQNVSELGGYIENSDVYNGSSYRSYRDLRRASLTIRIPQDKLDGFIKDMQGVSNVTNCNQRVEDVTLTYVDLESHKKALKTEQDRLLELLEIAETVEDIITIESRLSEVRYEIESMEAKLRSYDNRVNYSTIYMYIGEVEILTPVAAETAGERIVSGFAESVANVLNGIKEFFIGLIINLPYLFVWGIIIAVVILIVVRLRRRSRKKKNNTAEAQNKVINNIVKAEENDSKGI